MLKAGALREHYTHAAPLHRALLSLSEVLVSTSGPAAIGAPAGAQKGRASLLKDWHDQQSLLREEAAALSRAGGAAAAAAARPAAGEAPQRRLSGLAPAGKGGGCWRCASDSSCLRAVPMYVTHF
jgi:hypothetical protein